MVLGWETTHIEKAKSIKAWCEKQVLLSEHNLKITFVSWSTVK